MPRFTPNDIRVVFTSSNDFNQIFDAFEQAVQQRIQDVEVYRLLFWNSSLSPDEVCMFGEKLGKEFPDIAYDIFMWLASVFEVTYSSYDNFELAMKYYRKAANARPTEINPFLDAADCFDSDLNIPPVDTLLEFLRSGIPHVINKKPLLLRLAYLFEMTGNLEQSQHYRRLADDIGRNVN